MSDRHRRRRSLRTRHGLHGRIDREAQVQALRWLLADALDEWRYIMDAHGIGCESCRLEIEIYERHAREFGVKIKAR